VCQTVPHAPQTPRWSCSLVELVERGSKNRSGSSPKHPLNSRFYSQGKNSCHLRNEKPNRQTSYMASGDGVQNGGPGELCGAQHTVNCELNIVQSIGKSPNQLFTVCWLLTSLKNLSTIHIYTNYISLYLCLSGWLLYTDRWMDRSISELVSAWSKWHLLYIILITYIIIYICYAVGPICKLLLLLMLHLSWKEGNYGLHATKSGSCLIKFLVNNIHIYGFKLIYYENTFRS
jgi:hypothetical protein